MHNPRALAQNDSCARPTLDRREPYQLRQYVIFDAGKMLLDFASSVYANGGADARP
jgi:hypothetical protein